MRLKKLTVHGFKSFADKTTFTFENGISCIVGPNGCGKSNLIDAFKWVLGEQSSKSLRGSKMPDVIFCGTDNKKSANFADVTIVIDQISNSDGSATNFFDEITISRRLYSDGESQYLLNDKPIRLKELSSLFKELNIGKNALSIFEQGRVDRIINETPLERRAIFEEAAAISRFTASKQEALTKLTSTENNVNRVKDLHAESFKVIEALEKESQSEQTYRKLISEITHLQKKELFFTFKKNSADKSASQSEYDSLNTKILEATACKVQLQNKINILNEDLKELSAKSIKLQTAITGLEKELAIDSKELTFVDEQQNSLALSIVELQNTDNTASLRHKQLNNKLLEITDLLKKATDQKNLLQVETEAMSTSKDMEARQKILKTQSLELEKSILKSQYQASQRSEEIDRLGSLIAEKKALIEKNQDHISTSEILHKEIEKEIAELKLAKQKQSELVDKNQSRLHEIEIKLKAELQNLKLLNNSFEKEQKELFKVQAAVKLAEKMIQNFEGFSTGQKKLLQEASKAASPIYSLLKPFYSYLNTDHPLFENVSHFLSFYSQTLVVASCNDFDQILNFAQQNNIADFSLVCLEDHKLKSNLIDKSLLGAITDETLSSIFLSEVSICQTNVEHKNSAICIKDGFWDQRAIFFSHSSQSNPLFHLSQDRHNFQNRAHSLEKSCRSWQQKITSLNKELSELEKLKMSLGKEVHTDEIKLVEINFHLQKQSEKLQSSLKQAASNREVAEKLAQDISSLKGKLDQYQIERQKIEAELKIANYELEQKNLKYSELEKAVTALRGELQVTQDKFLKQAELVKTLDYELKLVKHEIASNQNHLDKTSLEIKNCQINSNNLTQKKLILKQKTVLDQTNLTKLEQKLKMLTEQKESFSSSKKELNNQLDQTAASLERSERQKITVENSMEQLKKESEAIASAISELGCTPAELSAEFKDDNENIDKIRSQILKLKNKLKGFENVNLTATEKLNHEKQNFAELNEQLNDLDRSLLQFKDLLSNIQKESREIFEKSFNEIRGYFRANFQKLFEGGEADLKVNGNLSDLTSVGIEIIAQPPGKKMQSISLLSGGEKCLTAMALLFAIFEKKGANFCLLDEIDAPLDDANIERLSKLLKAFASHCQFIIITHKKSMIEIAENIYGISMEKRGVSKMLNMKLSKNTEATVAASV